eukprot:104665_1
MILPFELPCICQWWRFFGLVCSSASFECSTVSFHGFVLVLSFIYSHVNYHMFPFVCLGIVMPVVCITYAANANDKLLKLTSHISLTEWCITGCTCSMTKRRSQKKVTKS